MKIAVINGQNHKGLSYTAGRILAKELAGDSGVTEFFLPRDLDYFCLGCYAYLEDEKKYPFGKEKKKDR